VAHRRSSGYLRLSEVGNHTAFSAQTGRSPLQLRNITQNGAGTFPLAPPFNTVASLAEDRRRQMTIPVTEPADDSNKPWKSILQSVVTADWIFVERPVGGTRETARVHGAVYNCVFAVFQDKPALF
jgi:hypothetical protein